MIAMFTLYAEIFPSSTMTFMSLIQALSTLRRVLVARRTPYLIASSKLWSDVALSSVTLATGTNTPFFRFPKKFLPPVRARQTRVSRQKDTGRAGARGSR